MFKKLFILIFFLSLFSPLANFALADNFNAGFVPGPIWYSKYPFFTGDELRIYTAIYNNTDYDLEGEAFFYDGNIMINQLNFSLARGVGARDLWVDYLATLGTHQFKIEIKNAFLTNSDGEKISFDTVGQTSVAQEVFVDGDNDLDGIGNTEDEDDDNDGVGDLKEIEIGTDPFTVDHSSTSPYVLNSKKETSSSTADKMLEQISEKININLSGNSDVSEIVDKIKFLNTFTEKPSSYLEDKLKEIEKTLASIENPNFITREIDQKKVITEQGEEKIVKGKNFFSSTTYSFLNNKEETEKSSETEKTESKNKAQQQENLKEKLNNKFKYFFNWSYLWILKILLFILRHEWLLFLVLVLLIYKILRSVVYFFVD